ncbi:MAG: LLM class flavin-dependent oxidoreductase [Nitrososphaerales archaeon]
MRFGLTVAPVLPILETTRYAQEAEAAGFETIWLSPSAVWFKDSIVYLARMASQTTKIGLGLMATTPYERHAITLAGEMATLNEMSAGRALLSVGTGVGPKVRTLGFDTSKPFSALKETIDVVRQLSSSRQPVTYDGKFAKVNRLMFPRAKQFPVYMAGSSYKSLRMSGEVGNGSMLAHFPPEYAKWAGEEMWDAAAKAGRDRKDVELLVQVMTAINDDKEEALAIAKEVKLDPTRPKAVSFYLGPAFWASKETRALERCGFAPEEIDVLMKERDYFVKLEQGAVDDSRLSSIIPPAFEDKICETLALVGDSEDCIKKLKAYEAAGVSEILFGFWGRESKHEATMNAIHKFRDEIIPQFN